MRVSIWVFPDDEEYEADEQERVGTFALRDESVVIEDAVGPDGLALMHQLLSEEIPVPNSYDRVTADDDPKVWLASLVFMYRGERLSARLEPDLESDKEAAA